ncbi:MAG: hypothetical protein ACI841_005448, partial [Planctomycetota bacterium]
HRRQRVQVATDQRPQVEVGCAELLLESLTPLIADSDCRRDYKRRTTEPTHDLQAKNGFASARRGYNVKVPIAKVRIELGKRARLVLPPRMGEAKIGWEDSAHYIGTIGAIAGLGKWPARCWSAADQHRHQQRIDCVFLGKGRLHQSPNHCPSIPIDHHSEVQPFLPDMDVGDVGDPGLFGPVCSRIQP